MSYTLTEILDWMWQVELQTTKLDAKPLEAVAEDDYEDCDFLQEDF